MSGKRIGYRRVSSVGQNLDRQELGDCDRIFEDKLSGGSRNRPGLEELLRYIRDGDRVVVFSIDRLARDLRDLQQIIQEVLEAEASIEFVKEKLTFTPDKDDPFQTLQLQMMGAFAQLERSLIRSRQAEGIAKAKERGVYKGRKRSINRDRVLELKSEGAKVSQIASELNISRMSVYRIVSEAA